MQVQKYRKEKLTDYYHKYHTFFIWSAYNNKKMLQKVDEKGCEIDLQELRTYVKLVHASVNN